MMGMRIKTSMFCPQRSLCTVNCARDALQKLIVALPSATWGVGYPRDPPQPLLRLTNQLTDRAFSSLPGEVAFARPNFSNKTSIGTIQNQNLRVKKWAPAVPKNITFTLQNTTLYIILSHFFRLGNVMPLIIKHSRFLER